MIPKSSTALAEASDSVKLMRTDHEVVPKSPGRRNGQFGTLVCFVHTGLTATLAQTGAQPSQVWSHERLAGRPYESLAPKAAQVCSQSKLSTWNVVSLACTGMRAASSPHPVMQPAANRTPAP
jgi:hypothetical protein